MLLHWQTNMAEWDRSEGGSLINTDVAGINRAREIKRKRREQEKEIQQLKNDVGEIKGLLNQLIENLKDGNK